VPAVAIIVTRLITCSDISCLAFMVWWFLCCFLSFRCVIFNCRIPSISVSSRGS
jgi:hypothetical protein